MFVFILDIKAPVGQQFHSPPVPPVKMMLELAPVIASQEDGDLLSRADDCEEDCVT